MTRLPQRSVEPGTAFQGINNEHHAFVIAPATPHASSLGIDKVHGNGGNGHTSVVQDRETQERLAANTIDNALELKSIDPISRINPTDATEHAGKIETSSELAWLTGPNLADSLLSFVTPRLRHSVVRPEQHGLLLERLADALSAAPEGSVAREGAALLQLELRRLILLRQNHNGLIQG